MYCSHCGKQMDASARFCPGCGAVAQPVVFGRAPFSGQLTRPRYPRAIGGVCSGLALHYGWDITTVRLLWVLCVLFAGTGVLAYIVAWIIIPEAPYELPEQSSVGSVNSTGPTV
jgi:phage shock protein C